MDNKKFNALNVWKENNLQSLICDPEFSNFFKWFDSNITQDNIISTDEIERCNELKDVGTFIKDPDEISKKFEEIGLETPYNENSLESFQDEFKDLVEDKVFFKDVVENSQPLMEECEGNAKALETLQVKNLNSLDKLKDCYTSSKNPPLLWCKLNLSDYCDNCEKFGLLLKNRAEEKLKLSHFVDQNDNETLKILFELNNIKKATFKKTIEKLTTESDVSMVNQLIGVLSGVFEPMSYKKMMKQTERMSYMNEDNAENIEHLRATLNEKIEQFALQEAKFCELESNQEKRMNAENRLEILKRIHEPLSSGLLVSEVLWILMEMEKEKTKNVLQNISVDHYKDESKRSARNMEILKTLSTGSDERIVAEFLHQFSDIIVEFVAPASLDNCIDVYHKSVNNNVEQLRKVASNQNQINILTLINDFNSRSQKMNEFIGDGPLDKPNLWNLTIVADVELQKHTSDFQENLLRQLRNKFMNEYHQPSVNDEVWKRRQYLWIWFLTDQTQFLNVFKKTIADYKSHQQLKVVPTVPQGVGGLRRQQ